MNSCLIFLFLNALSVISFAQVPQQQPTPWVGREDQGFSKPGEGPWLHYLPKDPVEGMSVEFTLDDTSTPSYPDVKYIWDFGDGSAPVEGASVHHVYSKIGIYMGKLTAKSSKKNRAQPIWIQIDRANGPTARFKVHDWEEIFTEFPDGGFLTALTGMSTFSMWFDQRYCRDPIVDGEWDFGDGTVGYGTYVIHTYFKPGTYKIRATGYDSSGKSDSATTTIKYPGKDCHEGEGDNICLSVENAVGNILPLSSKQWVVSHNNGNAKFPENKINQFDGTHLFLTKRESDERMVNLDDILTIAGAKILVSKEGLNKKITIDPEKSYFLMVNASNMSGSSPDFFFGAANLSVSASETGVYVEISNMKAKFERYFKSDSKKTMTFPELPFGTYLIVARKGDQVQTLRLPLYDSSVHKVTIDMKGAKSIKSEFSNTDEELRDRFFKGNQCLADDLEQQAHNSKSSPPVKATPLPSH